VIQETLTPGESALPCVPVESTAAERNREAALRALSELPPFSAILNRVMTSLDNDAVSLAELGDLIEKDPALAGNLLALVNSSLYSRRGGVSSVRHALTLLGLRKVRNVVLGMSIAGLWSHARRPPSWDIAQFNLHSAATALMADLLAVHLTVEYPEGAFAAGLLHDLGRLLIVTALPDEWAGIQRLSAAGGSPCDCERAIIGFAHEEMSEVALAFWRLPEPICRAVGAHHGALETLATGRVIPLGAVVSAADRYVGSLGIRSAPCAAPDRQQPDLEAIAALGLGEQDIERLATNFETEFGALAPLFR
jgi:HD-like signal output (HDOD) protein